MSQSIIALRNKLYLSTIKMSIMYRITEIDKLITSNKQLGYPTDIYEGIVKKCIIVYNKLTTFLLEEDIITTFLSKEDINVIEQCFSSYTTYLKNEIEINKNKNYPIDYYKDILLNIIEIYNLINNKNNID